MSRSSAKLTIYSCRRPPQSLEAFQLERQRDGELDYVADDAPPPAEAPPAPGLVPFVDRAGEVLAWAMPPPAGVVILSGRGADRYFVRAPAGFVEVDAVRANI